MKPWQAGLAFFSAAAGTLAFLGFLYWLAVLWTPDLSDKEDCATREGIFVQGGRSGDDLCLERDAVLKNYG